MNTKRMSKYLNGSALNPLFVLGAAGAMLTPAMADPLPTALPQGGNVVGGQATITQSGNTLNVNQSTSRTVIDWRSFDIGSNAQTNFNQPNAASIAVNRVNGSADPTQIEGGLHANGQVWILNPNGVLFGKSAHVDAAGIVASTANIDTTRFMAGDTRLNMTGADHGASSTRATSRSARPASRPSWRRPCATAARSPPRSARSRSPPAPATRSTLRATAWSKSALAPARRSSISRAAS